MSKKSNVFWRFRLAAVAALLACALLALPSVGYADGGSEYNRVDSLVTAVVEEAMAVEGDDSDGHTLLHLILLPAPGYSVSDVVQVVKDAGGSFPVDTTSTGGVAVEIEINSLGLIASSPAINYVGPDLPIAPKGGTVSAGTNGVDYAGLDGAPVAWSQGYDGAGVGIAVIDSGVAPVADFGDRLIHVEFGGGSGSDDSLKDTYGHGSFVAGVAAGRNASGYYRGVAPGATVYSLKVADDLGPRVADVLAGLHWVTQNAKSKNIRVAVLAFSENMPSSYHGSLLDAAVEHAWRAGVVVVTAAGNLGADSQHFAPSNDPFMISVGALNLDNQTATDFSSYGMTVDGHYRPDIFAPGRHIVSVLPEGSYMASQAPFENVISPGYGRANGTSFAAPQVGAAAAILLQKWPQLTPDQVKWLLLRTARPASVGKALDIGAAINFIGSVSKANVGLPYGNCFETPLSNDCSSPNGSYLKRFDPKLAWLSNARALSSAATWNGATWNGATWNGATWNGATWNGATWNGATWNGATWN